MQATTKSLITIACGFTTFLFIIAFLILLLVIGIWAIFVSCTLYFGWNWYYYSGHEFYKWYAYYEEKALKVRDWLRHVEDWDPIDDGFPIREGTPKGQYRWADDVNPPQGSESNHRRNPEEYQNNGWAPSA